MIGGVVVRVDRVTLVIIGENLDRSTTTYGMQLNCLIKYNEYLL